MKKTSNATTFMAVIFSSLYLSSCMVATPKQIEPDNLKYFQTVYSGGLNRSKYDLGPFYADEVCVIKITGFNEKEFQYLKSFNFPEEHLLPILKRAVGESHRYRYSAKLSSIHIFDTNGSLKAYGIYDAFYIKKMKELYILFRFERTNGVNISSIHQFIKAFMKNILKICRQHVILKDISLGIHMKGKTGKFLGCQVE